MQFCEKQFGYGHIFIKNAKNDQNNARKQLFSGKNMTWGYPMGYHLWGTPTTLLPNPVFSKECLIAFNARTMIETLVFRISVENNISYRKLWGTILEIIEIFWGGVAPEKVSMIFQYCHEQFSITFLLRFLELSVLIIDLYPARDYFVYHFKKCGTITWKNLPIRRFLRDNYTICGTITQNAGQLHNKISL